MNISDDYHAYCFDEAIAYIGNFIKAKLDEIEGKDRKEIEGKQKLVLMKIFDQFELDDGEANTSAFRDPMEMFNKRK